MEVNLAVSFEVAVFEIGEDERGVGDVAALLPRLTAIRRGCAAGLWARAKLRSPRQRTKRSDALRMRV